MLSIRTLQDIIHGKLKNPFHTQAFNLHLKWSYEVTNKNGKVLCSKTGISKSLVRNFMFWLQQWFTILTNLTYATAWTTNDTSNIARTFPHLSNPPQGSYGFLGIGANSSAWGLRVGSAIGGPFPTDYEMNTLIPHGSVGTQLVYNSQTVEAVTVVGQNTTFRVSRSFSNNSGATITIKEIGAAGGFRDSAGVDRYLLYLHDVLPSSVPVPDGSTFTLRYTFTVTT